MNILVRCTLPVPIKSSAVAWKGSGHEKRTVAYDFATSLAFQASEERIDSLLSAARTYLTTIQANDLQPMPYLREQ